MGQINKQILWKVSLGMISLYGGADDIKILEDQIDIWNRLESDSFVIPDEMFFGVPEATSKYMRKHYEEKVKTFFKNTFDIIDTSTFFDMLEILSGSNNLIDYMDDYRKKFFTMNYEQKIRLMKSIDQESSAYRACSLAIKHDHVLPDKGISAFNLSNYVNVCRLGAYLGYITKEQAIEYIDQIVPGIQNCYSSFKEYGLATTIGLIVYSGYEGHYDYYLYTLHQVLNHPQSYWKRLDWGMNIDSGK